MLAKMFNLGHGNMSLRLFYVFVYSDGLSVIIYIYIYMTIYDTRIYIYIYGIQLLTALCVLDCS